MTPEQRARETLYALNCEATILRVKTLAAVLREYGDERERAALGKIAEELRGPVMALLLELPESVHADFVQRVRRALAAKEGK